MTINISDKMLSSIQSQGFVCERCKRFISPDVVINENGININRGKNLIMISLNMKLKTIIEKLSVKIASR